MVGGEDFVGLVGWTDKARFVGDLEAKRDVGEDVGKEPGLAMLIANGGKGKLGGNTWVTIFLMLKVPWKRGTFTEAMKLPVAETRGETLGRELLWKVQVCPLSLEE